MSDPSHVLRGVTWSREETEILLAYWAKRGVQEQIESNARDHSAFEEMAEALNKSGYYRSWVQVRVKLKNLTQWYKTIRQKNISMGPNQMNRSQNRLYNRLHPILKFKPLVWRDNQTTSHSLHAVGNEEGSSSSMPTTPDYVLSPGSGVVFSNIPQVSSAAGLSEAGGRKQRSQSSQVPLSDPKRRGVLDNDHVPFIKRYMARLEAEAPEETNTQVNRSKSNDDATPLQTIVIKEESLSDSEVEAVRHGIDSATNPQTEANVIGWATPYDRPDDYPIHPYPNTFVQAPIPQLTMPIKHRIDLPPLPQENWTPVPSTSDSRLGKRKHQEMAYDDTQSSVISHPEISSTDERLVDKLVDKFTEHSERMQDQMLEMFSTYQKKFQETFLSFEEKRLKMQLEWEEKQKREEREHQLRMLQTLAHMFNTGRSNDGRSSNEAPQLS